MLDDLPSGRGRRTRILVAFGTAAVVSLAACSSSPHPHGRPSPAGSSAASSSVPPLGYRPLPSYLPTASTPVDRVVTATPSHPQLAVQGVAVAADVGSGHVLATVSGPRVPPFVTPPPPAVTATFRISFEHASGDIPIRLSDFTITDQLGRTFHPTLVHGETPPPADLRTGHSASFQLTAVMPTGEGRIYWAPTHSTPYLGWDFIVEND